ncbi:MAG: lipoprotein-releasing ABC transporter permease subunit [Gammaproteobacteria bacterium]|nr:lipoprotein-releasing ABC transporter permease subunit [Gammaproteobacteria bacterium]MDH3506806.1 lipoprotein-releasing ABC transporter permease subunit [Gammaproteobacteria bacterium]
MLRQPYELFTAFRYLRARSKNGFISFISLVSMVGIGLAVAVLIVVLSVMNGFERELQQRILGIVSHATLMGYDVPLEDWQSTRERILTYPEVTGAAPYVEGQGMVVFGERVAGVTVRGIAPALEQEISTIGELLRAGSIDALSPGDYRMAIGASLADDLGITVGDSIVLIIAQGRVTPAGLVPRMRRFEVAAIFEAGMYEYDRGLAYVNMQDAARLFRTDGKATGLRMTVENIVQAGSVARMLAIDLGGGFYIDDWTRQQSNFFRSIQLTKSIMFVILSMVIAVAVFNIVSTLVMVVRDKRGDIAILRTFGSTSRSLVMLFATQGTVIGLLGTFFGLLLGLLIAAELGAIVGLLESMLDIDLLSAEVYFISDLPTEVRTGEVVRICLIALALAIAATLYPAISASRQHPAEALRHE